MSVFRVLCIEYLVYHEIDKASPRKAGCRIEKSREGERLAFPYPITLIFVPGSSLTDPGTHLYSTPGGMSFWGSLMLVQQYFEDRRGLFQMRKAEAYTPGYPDALEWFVSMSPNGDLSSVEMKMILFQDCAAVWIG